MSQLLVHYELVVRKPNGEAYTPSVWGRRAGSLWVGWIEFEPLDRTSHRICTGRETEQATRDALMHWAERLTPVYFEGAVTRADGSEPPDEETLIDGPGG